MKKNTKLTPLQTLDVYKLLLKIVPDEMHRIKVLAVLLKSELQVGMDDAIEKKDRNRQAGIMASAETARYLLTGLVAGLEKQMGIKI